MNPPNPLANRSQSEEDFRTIVCNITGLDKDDPVFDRIREEDKQVIKSAKKAIDTIESMKKSDKK